MNASTSQTFTKQDIARAKLVGLAGQLLGSEAQLRADFCLAWVDSRGELCGKPRSTGLLCTRHHNTAERRMSAAADKQAARHAAKRRRERDAAPRLRKELDQIEAWLSRHAHIFEAPTSDRAASGGSTHPSIANSIERHWTRGLSLYPTWRAKQDRAAALRRRLEFAAE